MKSHRLTLIITTLALGVAAPALVGAPAFAAPPADGCPNGHLLLSVQAMAAEGYHAPALVDSPTSGAKSFGQPGNGDGWVCGVQLGNQLTSFGLPIYLFSDNQLPASG